jgi:hypothetical protein
VSTYGATVTIVNGTLINASGAIIRSLAGAGGARTIAAPLDNEGDVYPGGVGAAGKLSLGGIYTGAGALDIELGGPTQGTQYDLLAASGAVTLGTGTLNVTLINSYVPPTQSFTVLTYPVGTPPADFLVKNLPLGANGVCTASALTGQYVVSCP